MLAEVTEISFITDRAINPEYAKKLRGFFGNYYRNRFEFHQHNYKFCSQYPLCRNHKSAAKKYKTVVGQL